MAKNDKKGIPKSIKIPEIQKAKAGTLFVGVEAWMEKRKTKLSIFVFSLCILFSFLLFNTRISEGGDDSTYILAGSNYAKNFFHYYFSFNAPLYPMFLSLPISIFGLNLLLLKFLSLIFNFFSLFLLYKVFRDRMPHFVLFPILFVTAINSYFLYFASQTYNESFFLFFQSLFFYAFVRLTDKINISENILSKTYLDWLFLGLTMFILTMSKNVAIAVIPAVALYFLFNRKYLNALYSLGAFLCIKIPFEIFKYLAWGSIGQYGAQGAILLQKDPYDASKGTDDVMGFVNRFFDNNIIYLSKRLFQILGFMSENSTATSGGLAVFVILFILWGVFRIIKSQNQLLLMCSLYSLCLMGISFIVLQARWDQPRIVMLYVPFILIIVLYGIHHTLRNSSSGVQAIFLYFIIAITLAGFISSTSKIKENVPILTKNLKGDNYFGYTRDWVNYLRMSEWCGVNLPDNSLVACRKGPMSFIYSGGKEFFPVYSVFSTDPDSVLAIFKRGKVSHVLLGSLRRNPAKADGSVINTLHRIVQPVMEKYPDKIKQVHQEGTIEPAYLFQINY